VRWDKVDHTGTLTLRYNSRLYTIGMRTATRTVP
jgi:hypothetical protein